MGTSRSSRQDVKFVLTVSLSMGVAVALIGAPAPARASSTSNVSTVHAALASGSAEQALGGLSAPASRAVDASDPATWSDSKLAARLLLVGATSSRLSNVKPAVKKGVAGIVLFGTPPRNLASQLRALRKSAPTQRLIVSSDEEGGMVQRLTRLVGKMPSAKRIGETKTPAQTQKYAFKYGKRLKTLGVGTNLAPVADLKYPGSWTDRDGRAFKTDPQLNGEYVAAFARGMQAAGVMATLKHWPGGGAVVDTHKSAGRTPAWSTLQKRDLVPFQVAFNAGVGGVMVSHAMVPGLSGGLPATQSRAALGAVRSQAGPDALIITDSLMMAAVTNAMGQTQSRAAVRALVNGADLALVQGNWKPVRKAVAVAIRNGTLPREQAIAAVRRIIKAQQTWG